jgi:hypothetical protein
MNPPLLQSHVAYGGAEAILEELRHIFWAMGCQTECAERFASLADIDGLDHILGCLNASFRRAVALRQEIPDDRRP